MISRIGNLNLHIYASLTGSGFMKYITSLCLVVVSEKVRFFYSDLDQKGRQNEKVYVMEDISSY